MPVVVVGAQSLVGSQVAAALANSTDRPDVRLTVRSAMQRQRLAYLRVPVSVCDPDDAGRLGAVCENAHTVIQLDSPVSTWGFLLEALEGTTVRRIVTVLPPGTDAPPTPETYEVLVVHGNASDPQTVFQVLAADARA